MEKAGPISIRLPKPVLERLEQESLREGIPVAVLVRQSVMRDYPVVGGGSTKSQERTTDFQIEEDDDD